MSKPVKMMMLDTCPYCKKAFQMMDELKTLHPEYKNVDIDVIEENKEPERTEGYDYWYVPTFFVGSEKVLEGVPTIDKVKQVFEKALQN